MNILDILSDLSSHSYLALLVLCVAYLQRLAQPDSKFPWSPSPNVRNVVVIVLAGVSAGVAKAVAGATLELDVLTGITVAGAGGFADGMLAALFAAPATAPSWARALVLVFDDVTGGPGGSASAPRLVPNGKLPPLPEVPSHTRGRGPRMAFLGACIAVSVFLQGCMVTTPIVPVTAANADQVASCKTVGNEHNGIVIGDFALGAAGAGVGSVAAALPGSNASAKDVLAIVGVGIAAVTAIGTGAAELTATEYANDQCSALVSPPLSSSGKAVSK